MSTRFHFTTRDWIWFCLVFFLAFGWGGHFRYSMWLEDNVVANPAAHLFNDEDLMDQLKVAREKLAEERAYSAAVAYGTRRLLDEDARQELGKLIKEYYDCQGIPRPFECW